MSYLADHIKDYYDTRGLVWPNTYEALAWAHTELAEAYEILLAESKNWVRNNPDDKPEQFGQEFAVELGDAVMMLVVAGMVNGYDVIDELHRKMND